MPRNIQRKSATTDVRKYAKRQTSHPYNLRTRNQCTNYNEKHLSRIGMTATRRAPNTSVDISSQRSNDIPVASSRNSIKEEDEEPIEEEDQEPEDEEDQEPEDEEEEESRESRGSDEIRTNTLYVNENFSYSAETSSIDEYEDDSHTAEVEDNADNSSDNAELNDENYMRNYSASAYNYQELLGHSNSFYVAHAASEADLRNATEMGDHVGEFDFLATGDGEHNDPDVLEFSIRILNNDEYP